MSPIQPRPVAPRRLTLALLAAAVAALAVACARRGTSSPPAAGHERLRRQHEISAKDTQILDWRRELGLAPRPSAHLVQQMPSPFSGSERPAAPLSDACTEACDLADYICQAAREICDIAGELPGDDWAAEKCQGARASCSESRAKCGRCR